MAQHLIQSAKDLKEAVKELTDHKRLSHDTETRGPLSDLSISGLHPFHGSRTFSHIFATKEDEFYFDFNVGGINPKHKANLQPIFDDKDRIIFYVNAIYDATMSHFDGLTFKQRIIDCPSIARVEFNCHTGGRSYSAEESFLSMAYLAEYYGVQSKIDKVKQYIKDNNLYSPERCRFTGEKIPMYNLVPLELMFEYGCGDARTTYDLGTKIIKCLNYKDEMHKFDTKMINVAKNEIALTSALVDMKIDGAQLWTEYVEKAIKAEKEKAMRLNKEIENLTGGININSPKQIADLLLKNGVDLPRKEPTEHAFKMRQANLEKVEVLKKKIETLAATPPHKAKASRIATVQKKIALLTEKADDYALGNYVTDKKMLKKVMKKHPDLDFLTKISEAKQAEKKLSTYYGNFIKLKDANDVIHCELNQAKAITGRFSSSNPNFQNLHKEKWDGSENQLMIRKSIIPKHKDFELFFFDYSGQEMYIMIDLAEDAEVIKDILENGTDIYIAMANRVKEVTGIEITRAQAKALSLGIAYGQGIGLISSNLGCTLEEAKALKDGFLKALRGVARLSRRMMKTAEREKKIVNPYGRVSYILDKRFAYKALNSLIQGSAADCTKTAMVGLAELLKDKKSHMILQVHDEVVFELHKDEHYLIPEIKRIMSEAYPHKHLPLRVDVERSARSWGEKVDYVA